MDASNIKAVAPHLSSEQVQQLLDWMDVRGSERVVVFPDNAASRGGQIVACHRLGLRVELPSFSMSNIRSAPEWLSPRIVQEIVGTWSEMDFVSVLAEAYPLCVGLQSLETDPVLGCHFARVHHGENAADHARMAGDVVIDRADRRQHALQAIAYLGRLVELLDREAQS